MKTRLGPSPTGLMHLGTARTAYINYLMAKSSGGKFVLRLDDTDLRRNKEEYTQVILDSLEWLGLEYDELYYQSQRIDLYQRTARELLQQGKAFEATNGAIILKDGTVGLQNGFKDTIAGCISITDTNLDQIKDRIVLLRGHSNDPDKEDMFGQPTYQFASIVDDYDLGITNIIRGVDHITNTPKQIAVWNAIQENEVLPKFTHLGLIFKDNKKLSKRDGAASLLWYKEQEYKPEAVLDWMLRLGWSLRVPRGEHNKELNKAANEIIPKDMAIELFHKGTLKNSNCAFDLNKLNWFQKQYS